MNRPDQPNQSGTSIQPDRLDFSPRATVRRGGGKILTNHASTASERTRNAFRFFPRGQRAKGWGKNACNRALLKSFRLSPNTGPECAGVGEKCMQHIVYFFPRGYGAQERGKNITEPPVYGVAAHIHSISNEIPKTHQIHQSINPLLRTSLLRNCPPA